MGDKVSPNGLPPATTVSELNVVCEAAFWIGEGRCLAGRVRPVGLLLAQSKDGLAKMYGDTAVPCPPTSRGTDPKLVLGRGGGFVS